MQSSKQNTIAILLWVALALLIVDCAIQLGITSSYANWLNNLYSSNVRYALSDGRTISAVPEHLNQDIEHLCNDSGGVALVLIGLAGIVALLLKRRQNFSRSLISKIWYHAWLVLTLLSVLLSLGALIYVFVISNRLAGQRIDTSLLNGPARQQRWPYGSWDPRGWFGALLDLELALASDRQAIDLHRRLITGSMFNLIAMFILGLAVTVLAILNGVLQRRKSRSDKAVLDTTEHGH